MMNKFMQKMATFMALVLISAMPFSVDMFATTEKEALLTILSKLDKPADDQIPTDRIA